MIGWTVFIGVLLAALFALPPLSFDEVKTGYLYTGAFIGALLGLVLSGLFADRTTRLMVKWNKGKFEPEFRITLVVFQLIFSGIGLYGFGFVTDNVGRYGWLPADVFFMFVTIGMVMGAVASALYIVDAHRKSHIPNPCVPLPTPSCSTLICSFNPLVTNVPLPHRPNRRGSVHLPPRVQEHVQLLVDMVCL
jgi:hypothetical protein